MDKDSPRALFGLSSQRLRGMLVLALAFLLIYLILFERDPPPSFQEVAVEIPPAKQIDYEQKEFAVAEPQPRAEDEDAAAGGDSPVLESSPVQPEAAPRIKAAEASAAPSVSGGFRIQMVALSDPDKAEDFAARLAELLKTDVGTAAVETDGETLYRVWLGPFASKEAAEEALDEFAAADEDGEFDFAAAKILFHP